MDWAKAKNILIFIFVLLNLFLSITLITLFNSDNISGEAIDNTVKVLENRGIVLDCEIPLYNKEMGTLISTNTILDKDLIIKSFFGEVKYIEETFNESINAVCGNKKLVIEKANTFVYNNSDPREAFYLTDSKRVQNQLANLFKEMKIPFEKFYFDKTEETSEGQKIYTFRQKKEGFWLYSNYVEVAISQNGITYLKYNNRNAKEISGSQKIVPAYQILVKNLIDDSGTVISKIDLGFGEQVVGDDTKVLDDIPVWRITAKKSEKIVERYFKVYNGEEVKLNDK
jgi:regulatory protein YycI of two-component signal transduction system YycFG